MSYILFSINILAESIRTECIIIETFIFGYSISTYNHFVTCCGFTNIRQHPAAIACIPSSSSAVHTDATSALCDRLIRILENNCPEWQRDWMKSIYIYCQTNLERFSWNFELQITISRWKLGDGTIFPSIKEFVYYVTRDILLMSCIILLNIKS
jgi:hypothetical protein